MTFTQTLAPFIWAVSFIFFPAFAGAQGGRCSTIHWNVISNLSSSRHSELVEKKLDEIKKRIHLARSAHSESLFGKTLLSEIGTATRTSDLMTLSSQGPSYSGNGIFFFEGIVHGESAEGSQPQTPIRLYSFVGVEIFNSRFPILNPPTESLGKTNQGGSPLIVLIRRNDDFVDGKKISLVLLSATDLKPAELAPQLVRRNVSQKVALAASEEALMAVEQGSHSSPFGQVKGAITVADRRLYRNFKIDESAVGNGITSIGATTLPDGSHYGVDIPLNGDLSNLVLAEWVYNFYETLERRSTLIRAVKNY